MLGQPGTRVRYTVTAEAISAYAAATDDTAPDALAGRVAPPVFAIVPVWDAIVPASRAVASDETRRRVVHYEQDMILHRPIEAGMVLVSRATPVALLPRPNGTSLVIRLETRDEGGDARQRAVRDGVLPGRRRHDEGRGERAPDHSSRGRQASRSPSYRYPIATTRRPVREGVRRRLRRSTSTTSSRASVGLPGRIVHGLCTMAFTGRAVLEAAGSDDPVPIRRLAVRFSAPLFPGDTLTTRIWRLGDGVYGFDATGPTTARP